MIQKYWGTLPSAMLTLMQIATYENWANIAKYVDDRILYVSWELFSIPRITPTLPPESWR